ncbi:universal stress protein [Bacillus kwashiorkori]|uniref:universal stress protein n=1 Tax=Bacillus kwashiorkori TaxID=1522318 RepID=UPI000781385E|nr:universal stress protein [Bacillus kwashiorkori]
MAKKIIVPIDNSIHSHRAFQFAVNLAQCLKGEIILLNVQPNIATTNVKRFISQDEIDAYLQELGTEIIDNAIQTVKPTVPIEKVIRIGVPKVEICKEAKEANAYCIVMGSRGMGPIKGAVIGSVSYGVLHFAPCPVTIVP